MDYAGQQAFDLGVAYGFILCLVLVAACWAGWRAIKHLRRKPPVEDRRIEGGELVKMFDGQYPPPDPSPPQADDTGPVIHDIRWTDRPGHWH